MEIIEIPNKSTFKLNEVCSITGVKPYVLRFWESEFDQIEPITSSTGQKLYSPGDIEVIATVKDLLFNQKMSIEEARYKLKQRLDGHSDTLEQVTSESEFDADEFPRVPQQASDSNDLLEDSISLQRMSLSDIDLEKLVTAKGLLQDIVNHQSLY